MKRFASIKLTVFCLFWLGVLTFVGTLYQVENGIYLAQERYFSPLIWWAFDFLPLPGGLLTLGALFLNLTVSMFYHYQAGLRMPGLLMIHLGLIMLLAGGFITRITGIEANVSLLEGEGTNVAQSVREWELALWESPGGYRQVYAYDLEDLRPGVQAAYTNAGIRVRVVERYAHADVELSGNSISGFTALELEKDPGQNRPALVLEVEGVEGAERLLLTGRSNRPVGLQKADGALWFMQVQSKRYELPLFMALRDFRHEYYPGSRDPKDYRSLVTVHLSDTMSRDVTIKMNHPLRMNGWTFYQSSFSVQGDSELSVFAVTRNFGRLIPYVATGITSLGLAMHFLQMQWLQARRRKRS